ncbi:TrbC/VirB2 family protein [Legionella pneumophila serogroup 1]
MSKFNKCIQFLRNHLSEFYVIGVCALLPSLSYAQSIESIINRTINYLQGGLARTVGVFCIIIAGYLCLARQKFPKEYFVMILVGMGIIFGGSSLYSTLIG